MLIYNSYQWAMLGSTVYLKTLLINIYGSIIICHEVRDYSNLKPQGGVSWNVETIYFTRRHKATKKGIVTFLCSNVDRIIYKSKSVADSGRMWYETREKIASLSQAYIQFSLQQFTAFCHIKITVAILPCLLTDLIGLFTTSESTWHSAHSCEMINDPSRMILFYTGFFSILGRNRWEFH